MKIREEQYQPWPLHQRQGGFEGRGQIRLPVLAAVFQQAIEQTEDMAIGVFRRQNQFVFSREADQADLIPLSDGRKGQQGGCFE